VPPGRSPGPPEYEVTSLVRGNRPLLRLTKRLRKTPLGEQGEGMVG
jgi:hypothetical protein